MSKVKIVLICLVTFFIVVLLSTSMKYFNININRVLFKSSIAYTEGTAEFLAKSYKEYNNTDSLDEKKSIMNYVILRYPNINLNNIENQTLRTFYHKCLGE